MTEDRISRRDFFAGCALVGLLSFLGNRGLGIQDDVVEHAAQLANLLVDELDAAYGDPYQVAGVAFLQTVANLFEKLDQNSPPQATEEEE